MTHDEMIAVIQAHKDGKKIEYLNGSNWQHTSSPLFDFCNFVYRVKPSPMEVYAVMDATDSTIIASWLFKANAEAYAGRCVPPRQVYHLKEVL